MRNIVSRQREQLQQVATATATATPAATATATQLRLQPLSQQQLQHPLQSQLQLQPWAHGCTYTETKKNGWGRSHLPPHDRGGTLSTPSSAAWMW